VGSASDRTVREDKGPCRFHACVGSSNILEKFKTKNKMKQYKETVLANSSFKRAVSRALALTAKYHYEKVAATEQYNRDDNREGLEFELKGPDGDKLTLQIFVQLGPDDEQKHPFPLPEDAILAPNQHHFLGRMERVAQSSGKRVRLSETLKSLMRDFQYRFTLSVGDIRCQNGTLYADLEKGFQRGWRKYNPLYFRFGLLACRVQSQVKQTEA
jgi:hypothetical protein